MFCSLVYSDHNVFTNSIFLCRQSESALGRSDIMQQEEKKKRSRRRGKKKALPAEKSQSTAKALESLQKHSSAHADADAKSHTARTAPASASPAPVYRETKADSLTEKGAPAFSTSGCARLEYAHCADCVFCVLCVFVCCCEFCVFCVFVVVFARF